MPEEKGAKAYFDSEKDITEKEWEQWKENLEKERQEGNWQAFLSDAAPMKILFPEKDAELGLPTLTEKDWQSIRDSIEPLDYLLPSLDPKHQKTPVDFRYSFGEELDYEDATSAFLKELSHAANIRILSPDWFNKLYKNKNFLENESILYSKAAKTHPDYGYQGETLKRLWDAAIRDRENKVSNWGSWYVPSFARAFAVLFSETAEKKSQEFFGGSGLDKETLLRNAKEALGYFKESSWNGNLLRKMAALNWMYPGATRELNLEKSDWESMKGNRKRSRYPLSYAADAKVVAAEDIKMTDKGLEIVMPGEAKE